MVVLAGVLVVAVPDATAAPTDADPPGRLQLQEVSIAAGEVSGGRATLRVDTRLSHEGGPVENATLELRAADPASGLVVTTRRRSVGRVAASGERRVVVPLSVPREGDYRVETRLYAGDERVDEGATSVAGVDALRPPSADSSVRFERYPGLGAGAVEYSVRSAGEGRVELSVGTSLTNAGDAETGLRVEVTAREAASGVVADRTSVDVGRVEPFHTVRVSGPLTVPDDHNYALEATLWKDGVVVGTAASRAVLAPGEPTPEVENATGEGFSAGEFSRGDGQPTDGEESVDATDGGGGSGFGVVAALVAVVVVTLAAGRRR